MKLLALVVTAIFVNICLSCSLLAAENPHDDHHNHHPKADKMTGSAKDKVADSERGKVTTKNPLKKFVVDAALKTRMDLLADEVIKLGLALEKMLKLENNSSNDKKTVLKESGRQIQNVVNDIFKNCTLSPEADSTIHPILADILNGAKLLGAGNENEGLKIIHKAFLRYGDSFDHPGWMRE